VTFDDFDLICPKAECIGDKFYDGRIRLPTLGRRRDLNLDRVAEPAGETRAAGARNDLDVESGHVKCG